MERLLPQIVEAIASVKSSKLDDYIQAIRANVCSVCPNEREGGRCEIREKVKCALNAYLALLVDVVESEMDKE